MLLQLLEGWSHATKLSYAKTEFSSGKRPRGACTGQQPSLSCVSPVDTPTVVVATLKTDAVIISGNVGENCVQMMLDSGSSLSLLRRDSLSNMAGIQQRDLQ